MQTSKVMVTAYLLSAAAAAHAANPVGVNSAECSSTGTSAPVIEQRDAIAALYSPRQPGDGTDLTKVDEFDLANIQYPSGYSSADLAGVTIKRDAVTGVLMATLYLGDDPASTSAAASGPQCSGAVINAGRSGSGKKAVVVQTGVTNTKETNSDKRFFEITINLGVLKIKWGETVSTTNSVSASKTPKQNN